MGLSENGWTNVRRAGIGLLASACAATFVVVWWPGVMAWVAFGLFLAVGAVDVALVVAKQKTISQRIHAAFPQWLDFMILAVLMGLLWLGSGMMGFVLVLMGVVLGHLFWHED